MCHQKVHHCKYCHHMFFCALKDVICPSLNDDEDANMCDDCREELEEQLARLNDNDGDDE